MESRPPLRAHRSRGLSCHDDTFVEMWLLEFRVGDGRVSGHGGDGYERVVDKGGLVLVSVSSHPVAAAAQQIERVQPGSISSDLNETFPMVDPVDGSLWFSRYERG